MAFPFAIASRLDCIPSNNEQDACDCSVGDRFGNRSHNGVIRNADAVRGGIAHAGHVAALDSSVQKGLLGSVLVIGQLLFTVAERDLETELVGVDLFMGERGLVAERSQRPALRGFDAYGVDFDGAEGVVNDLCIGRSGNGAVGADSDGQNGRNSDCLLYTSPSPRDTR